MRIELFKYLVKHKPTDMVVAGFNSTVRVVEFLKAQSSETECYTVLENEATYGEFTVCEYSSETFLEYYGKH